MALIGLAKDGEFGRLPTLLVTPWYGRERSCVKLLPGRTMAQRFDDARRWRAQAEEARIIADQMKNRECKQLMVDIALGYMELARMAEAREADRRKFGD